MPDINSYALNLELTLRDQASEALRSMVNMSNQVETKLKDIQVQLNNLETGSINIGKNIVNSIKQIGAQDISRINIANQGLDVAKQQQEITEKIQDTTGKYQDDLSKTEKKYQDKNTKFTKLSLRNMLRKIAGQKQTAKMTKQDIKDERSKEGIMGRIARGILEARRNQKGLGKDTEKSIGTLDGSRVILDHMNSGIETIKSAVGGMFKALGVGQLASLTSGWELLKVGVQNAADMSEKFHTVNYRNIGSMNEMANGIIDLGTKGLPVLRDELVKSTIALREMGGTKDVVSGLNIETAELGRSSGVSAEEIAKFAVRLTGMSGDIKSTRGEMALMNRMQKNLGLSGENVRAVMENISDQTFFLGSSGSAAMGSYQKAMYGLSGAANKMGVGVGQVTKNVGDAVKTHAIQIDAIVGKDAKNYEERMKNLSDYTKDWMKQRQKAIETDPSGKQVQILNEQITELYQTMGIQPDDKILQVLAGANDAGKDVNKTLADLDKNAKEELQDAANSTRALAREQQLSIDRVESNVQKMFEGVREQIENLFKKFNLDPANAQFAAWGLAGVAAASMIIGAITGIVGAISSVIIALKIASVVATAAGLSGGAAGASIAAGFVSAGLAVTGFLTIAAGLGYIAYEAVSTAKELRKIKDESDAIADSVRKANVKLEDQRKIMHTNNDEEIKQLQAKRQALIDQRDDKSALETAWSTKWTPIGLAAKGIRVAQAQLNKGELEQTEKQIQVLLKKRGEVRKQNAVELVSQQEAYKVAQKSADAHGMVYSRINEEAARLGVKTEDITSNQQRMAVVNRSILDDLREQTKQYGKQYTEQDMLTKLQDEKNKLISQGMSEKSVGPKAMENLIRNMSAEMKGLDPISVPVTTDVSKITDDIAKVTDDVSSKLINVNVGGKDIATTLSNLAKSNNVDISKDLSELSKLSNMSTRTPVSTTEAKIDPITTTKMIDGSLRTDEQIDAIKEQSGGILKMISSVDSIRDKIGAENSLEIIIKMMREYLPEIAEGKRSGLSAIANQWQPT